MIHENSQKTIYSRRIIFDLALFFCVLFFPWWSFVLIGFIGGSIFKNYFELIVFGSIMDALYGTEALAIYDFRLVFSLAGIILFSLAEFLKTKIRFFDE